ncbi:carbohydrate ABC transporter permease [Niallia nealsonii]|uniref:Carbohydrate ABC transporter permease n=1 Tax=Niallia nealsonii TaxID=115979 RepID=A0A2N0Z815_9BACI|nr:carbohydrate ABC transporter permease [Niallia nealsonii]PKG25655.1 carbohydrate ABC transporter permease [Niallia nealsonii]
MKKNNKWLIIVMAIIGITHIFPFYLLITTSFKPMDDPSSKWSLPSFSYLDNFKNAWEQANLGQAFFNNIVITAFSIILVIVIGAFASYPLARYKTRLNKFMYLLFISALIVPPLTILVPLYKFIVDIGGMNSYWSIILLHVTFNLPMTIFLFTGFISSIPVELDEAAMMDGMSRFGLFFRIIMPLLKPITATATILAGVNVWNDYQFSVFFLQSPEMKTMTVSLSSFFSQYTNNIGWVAAGSLLSALPIIILYLFLQKYFVSGLSSGAVKG